MSAVQWAIVSLGLIVAAVALLVAACERRRLRCCQPRPPGVDRRRRARARERKHNRERHA